MMILSFFNNRCLKRIGTVLLLALVLHPPCQASGPECVLKSLKQELAGINFLRHKFKQLEHSPYVQKEGLRLKASGAKNPEDPSFRIASWLNTLKHTHSDHKHSPQMKAKLKAFYERHHVIKAEDVPESHFELQQRIARARGEEEIQFTQAQRQRQIQTVINEQRDSLAQWLDYFSSADSDFYPMWAKYWAFEGVLKLVKLDPSTWTFPKRGKRQVAPYPELNQEALSLSIDTVQNLVHQKLDPKTDPQFLKIAREGHFGKIYAWHLRQINNNQALMDEVTGHWVMYERGSDPIALVKSLQGKNTGWCTAGYYTAREQLADGNFYVYYSNDFKNQPSQPRIAIRMNGARIAEVRGIAKHQNLDPHMANTSILKDKLAEFGVEGEKYIKRASDMRTLSEIEQKHRHAQALTQEEIKFLYEIDQNIEGFGNRRASLIVQLLQERDPIQDLSFALGLKKNEISINDEAAVFRGGIKFYIGDIYVNHPSQLDNLPLYIKGELVVRGVKSLKNFQFKTKVSSDVIFEDLAEMENVILPIVGRNIYVRNLVSANNVIFPETVGTLNLDNLVRAHKLILPRHVKFELQLNNLDNPSGVSFPDFVGMGMFLEGITSAQAREQIPSHFEGIILFKDGELNLLRKNTPTQ